MTKSQLIDLERWLNESGKTEEPLWEKTIAGLKKLEEQYKEQFEIKSILEWFVSDELVKTLKGHNDLIKEYYCLEHLIATYWSTGNSIRESAVKEQQQIVEIWLNTKKQPKKPNLNHFENFD